MKLIIPGIINISSTVPILFVSTSGHRLTLSSFLSFGQFPHPSIVIIYRATSDTFQSKLEE